MKTLHDRLRKYFIMGSKDCDRDPVAILKEAVGAGITAFQYREKGPNALEGEEKLKLGKQLRHICKENNVLFIVNDEIELVEALDADGIHVGQKDRSAKEVRNLFPDKIIGLSLLNIEEFNESPIDYVDYLGAGPIFYTNTKPDVEPVGIEWIQTLKKKAPTKPIVGIGGINIETAPLVLDAGADGVAFITAVTKAKDIKETVDKL